MSNSGDYPLVTPGNAVSRLPIIDAERYSHVGRYAGALVLAAFESIGGLERFAGWCDQNPGELYVKLLPKVIQRTQQVDVSGTVNIDDAISRLQSIEVLDTELKEREWDL